MMMYVFITNRPENFTHGNLPWINNTAVTGIPDVYIRGVFWTTVDRITRLNFTNFSSSVYIGNSSFSDLVVYVQYGLDRSLSTTLQTPRKLYQNATWTVPYYSAYFRFSAGRVTNLTWDDGCSQCSGDQCVDNNCGLDTPTCLTNTANPCEVKVYIAWLGQDGSGAWCTSAGYLPSNFRIMTNEPLVQQASGADQKNFIFF